MPDDEQAIRELVNTWMDATRAGDTQTVLSLMDDDALFTVAGAEPFDKSAFAAGMQGQTGMEIDGKSDIQEIKVLGDWAYMRNYLTVNIKMPDGKQIRRSGYTLTILRKADSGNWVLVRDANLMT